MFSSTPGSFGEMPYRSCRCCTASIAAKAGCEPSVGPCRFCMARTPLALACRPPMKVPFTGPLSARRRVIDAPRGAIPVGPAPPSLPDSGFTFAATPRPAAGTRTKGFDTRVRLPPFWRRGLKDAVALSTRRGGGALEPVPHPTAATRNNKATVMSKAINPAAKVLLLALSRAIRRRRFMVCRFGSRPNDFP